MAVIAPLAHADDELVWALVEPASGQTVPMSNVAFLLASDYADTFSVVCGDGTLLSGVTEISFTRTEASGIDNVKGDVTVPTVSGYVAGALIISGVTEGMNISVYNYAGAKMMSAVSAAGTNTIDVSGLRAGVYILTVGKTSVKFTKK